MENDSSRQLRKLALDSEIRSCRRCVGMNIDGVTPSGPGYGALTSPVALVGQSLCEKCMESQIPFTGGSGELIDRSIELEIVRPRLVITLGRDAERVLTFFYYPRARVSLLPFEAPLGRLPKGVPYILNAKHASWIQRQHDDRLEAEYISGLAAAIRWSFEFAGAEG